MRRRRRALDLTQAQLAQRVGLATTTVRKIEADERRPSREVAALLAEALELPAVDHDAFLKAARAEQRVQSLDEQADDKQPLASHRDNLPVSLTRFVGRTAALAEVSALITRERLVTLVGPGGSGKTRLALEVGSVLRAAFPDGVWLVELAGLNDAALLANAVAAALGVREQADVQLIDVLIRELRTRRMLILLDNCEHVIDACARVTEMLLRGCPDLHILTTSRESLHVPGEIVWPVPPLELRDAQSPPPDDLLGSEAVQLFLDRARAAAPAFQIGAEQAPLIAQICERLDGMPLAIELAAACVPVLSLGQLAARLDDRLHFFVGGNRTLVNRQQTLRAAIDWSYDLLAEGEKILFRRLAIFAGGWTLEAAEAICAGAGIERSAIVMLTTRLVDQSIVVVRGDGAQRRYSLLETIRQYASERLQAAGEVAQLSTQHFRWYLERAREAGAALQGERQDAYLRWLDSERDNLRSALVWGFVHGEPNDGLRMASALYWYWYLRNALSEGRAWFERALAQTDAEQPDRARASALTGTGIMAFYQGDLLTAHDYLSNALPIWRGLQSTYGLSLVLFGLGLIQINRGDACSAEEALEESKTLFQQQGLQWSYGMALLHLGDVALDQGAYATAQERYEESLAIQRAIGNTWGIAQLHNVLGDAARCTGDYAAAGEHYDRSLALFRSLKTSADLARVLHSLGYVARAQGEIQQAHRYFEESLTLFRERGAARGMAECFVGLASLIDETTSLSDARRAALLLGAAAAQLDTLGAALWPADRNERARSEALLVSLLGHDDLRMLLEHGRTLSLEQADTQRTNALHERS